MSSLNEHCLLVAGVSGTGKTASLRNIKNQDKWLYCCTEAGKQIPFKHSFKEYPILNPMDFINVLDYAIKTDEVKGVILDSLDFLLQQFESQYVNTAHNTMKGWSQYGEFFRTIMQDKVPKLQKPIIFIAHNQEVLDERSNEYKVSVVVKGSLKQTSVEAYFNTIIYTKKVRVKDLPYQNDLLHITPSEERKNIKYCFQTDVVSTSTEERVRSPIGLWAEEELYIDNDVQAVLDRLTTYYN